MNALLNRSLGRGVVLLFIVFLCSMFCKVSLTWVGIIRFGFIVTALQFCTHKESPESALIYVWKSSSLEAPCVQRGRLAVFIHRTPVTSGRRSCEMCSDKNEKEIWF